MADSFVPVTFVADELLTSTKMNLLAANQAGFNDGTALGDGIIVTRHVGDGEITSKKLGKHIEIGTIAGLNTTGSKEVSGLGFMPKAIEFIIAPPTKTSAGNIYQAQGLATPTRQFGYGISQSSSGNQRFRDDSNALILKNPVGTLIFSGSVTSWDEDGFTVNIAVAGGVDDRIFWIAHA